MRNRFRLPPLPIAGHVMLLVIVVLIIAQGATLVLTLVFPPQPPVQHSLEDIAKTLRGQTVQAEDARPLVRQIADRPPLAEGPGWLSAEGPRDRLAALLKADPSDVVLMFYVPLPPGAQPMAPHPAPPSTDAASPRAPRIVAAAFLPDFSAGPTSSIWSTTMLSAPMALAMAAKLSLSSSPATKRRLQKSTWFFFSAPHWRLWKTTAVTGMSWRTAVMISTMLMPQAPSPA